MNKKLEEFARSKILEGLLKLPRDNQLFFNKMYSHNKLDASPEEVSASMNVDKLDWAMTQLSNTLEHG